MKVNQVYKDFFLQRGITISILYGGSGSGKSHAITQKLIVRALEKPQKILVIRRTQVTLRDSVIALFLHILNEESIDFKFNATRMELQIGDSLILFKGVDDPERIKSIHGINICWIEEASELNPDAFTQLILRLRDVSAPPEFILSFNPISTSNWCYRFFFDSTGSEYFLDGYSAYVLKTTWRDNYNNLPQTYIDSLLALKRSNPMYYNVYSEGEWGVLGKLIFPYGSYQIQKLTIPSNAKLIDGLDLGWNDPNGLACSAVWREGDRDILYTYRTWSASECTADVIANVLKQFCGTRMVYGDNAAAAQIAEIQKKGVYNLRSNTKLPGSVLADINTIKCYDWYIDPSCLDLIRELGVYQWKKDKNTGLYLEEPERGSGESHVNVIDGVRYSLEALGNSIKSLKIKAYGL